MNSQPVRERANGIRQAVRIHSLRVNDHTAAMGADGERIRFSWLLSGGVNGISVRCIRIIVASSKDRLTFGEADVWDSGERSGALMHLDYSGPRLPSRSRYWWKVFVSLSSGESAESEEARFDTGLDPDDWTAEWIWSTEAVGVNDHAYLRKEYSLEKPVALAKLFYSAHNTAQVFIDGVRIGGYGSPAPTNPYKRKYYLAYDVTSLLHHSSFCISAVAQYLGGGGQNYVNGLPGFRLQLEIEYADGTRASLGTDTTWEALIDIPHRNSTPYQQNRRISAMEDYDARLADPAWRHTGFDGTRCKPAALARIGRTEWPMSWQAIPEGAVEELLVPEDVTPSTSHPARNGPGEPEPHGQVFDGGKIVSGWVRMALKGIAGCTVRIRYSEDLDEQGFVKHHVCNEPQALHYDQYTMRGDEEEVWQADLSYKAFRYAEISGYPGTIVPGVNVWFVSAHTDMASPGSFRSSSALLNDLFAACMQTQKNNTLGQTVDCPHREQAQYLADTDLQAETLLYNFEARNVLSKTLEDFADGQLDDGTFPFVYPSNYEDPAFHLQIPEWDLHYCTLLWKTYFMYEDAGLLERCYTAAKRMVDYYLGIIDEETGLIPLDKGWHISDWPYPTVDHECRFLTVQNIKLYAAVRIVSQIAGIIGVPQDQGTYRLHAERLKESIVSRLYDPMLKRFRDGLGSERTHQGVNAIALYYKLEPENDRKDLIDYIASTPWESKTVLSLPLLRVLFENGKEEAAYRLIHKESYPGWGYMISQGAKTMWEGWDDIESHCHAWNGYPARLLQEYVTGIRPLAPGLSQVLIKPYMPDDLDFAESEVPTVRGPIRVRWERGAGTIRLSVGIPPATEAAVVMNGHPDHTSLASGIKEFRQTDSGVRIDVSPGNYEFLYKNN